MDEKKRVLILCTGNSCRSQMAEGWVRNDLGDRVEAYSAGRMPCFVHPLAVEVMAEAGVDISEHRSKPISEFWGDPFDLVVTVCEATEVACPTLPGAAKRVHEPIPDPVVFDGLPKPLALEKFRESRDLIRQRIVPLVRRELFA